MTQQDVSLGAALVDLLEVRGRCCVYLIGGGGKTTVLRALAANLGASARVVVTTTTRVMHAEVEGLGPVLIGADIEATIAAAKQWLPRPGVCVVAKNVDDDGKLHGHTADDVDRMVTSGAADIVLVEADGAAGRPIKAHAAHEPVVSDRADLVIAVVGADVVGSPLVEDSVHRASLAASRLHCLPGATLDADAVARLLLHPEEPLLDGPGELAILISRAGAHRPQAIDLAQAIRRVDTTARVGRLAFGELVHSPRFVELDR